MIDYDIEYLFKMIESSVHNHDLEIPSKNINWDKLQKIVAENKVLPFVLEQVKKLPEEYKPSKELVGLWEKYAFKLSFNQLVAINELKALLKDDEIMQIKLLFFKGVILSRLYPNLYSRYSCDFDILAQEEDREKLDRILIKNGYKSEKQKENVQVYYKPNKIKIELHFSLFEDFKGKKIDYLNELKLSDWNKHTEIDFFDNKMCTLEYEDHLIYQFFHIIKHFSFERISLRYVIDIALFVDEYGDKIDWNSFWKKMKKLNYHRFAECLFASAQKYFGMKTSVLEKDISDEEITFFIKDVILKLDEEVVDHTMYDNQTMLIPYLFGESKMTESGKFGVKMSLLFPKAENLSSRYNYAKKCKPLIIIAWIERMIRHLYAAYIKKKSNSTAFKVDDVSERIILLHKLGLIE